MFDFGFVLTSEHETLKHGNFALYSSGMVPELRKQFNAQFSMEKYREFLRRMDQRCGTEIHFRVSETPCFFPSELASKLTLYGNELVEQLLGNPAYRKASDAAIPKDWNVPSETADPMWMCVDFGLVREPDGTIEPKLVELQAFPSLYAYQPQLAEEFIEYYNLSSTLTPFLDGLETLSYTKLLERAIVAGHSRENVVLLEIDPVEQKTLPDFLLTQRMLDIPIVNLRNVTKEGRRIFYKINGKHTHIARIYNRCIVDELIKKQITPPFDYRDELDVEWAGHPNWYYRISKFSIPWLKHKCVPRTWYLDQLYTGKLETLELPLAREELLLKPLYSFAGAGIVFAPDDAQLNAIPVTARHDYILQERVHFTPVIETPHGLTQAEIRVMYVWLPGEKMKPVLLLVRMGRGKMMGVDHNRNLEWVGGSVGLMDTQK